MTKTVKEDLAPYIDICQFNKLWLVLSFYIKKKFPRRGLRRKI